jgi:simple sugar transport system ATP-binding protein
MINIHKWFGKYHVLKGVDFTIGYNEVIGLLGDNGAGKSTLIKILSGVYRADEGEIYVEGKKVSINSPKDARRLGIETVYQDQALVPEMNVIRNIFMGREPTKLKLFLNIKKMEEEGTKILREIGLYTIPPNVSVKFLSGGEKQGVAIARAMYFRTKLLILDEPTAALSIKESQRVLEFVKTLKSQGVSVVFITHNLYHVYPVADRFVILSHGRKVGDIRKEETSVDELTSLIITE